MSSFSSTSNVNKSTIGPCASCIEKRKNPHTLRPYTLEYLALKTVLQKSIDEKTIDKNSGYLTSELCCRKYYRWCFFLNRNHLLFHFNEIVAIGSEENQDNRRILFERDILRTRCIFCHSLECVFCRWKAPFVKYGTRTISSQGHYSHCDEKY